MGIVHIQVIDLFTRSVIKMMTLRSKPKRQYHPRGRHGGHNVHFQNSASKADLRCSGHQCLLCGPSGLMQLRLVLAQHALALAARLVLRLRHLSQKRPFPSNNRPILQRSGVRHRASANTPAPFWPKSVTSPLRVIIRFEHVL